ncbi:unnamed protein product [Gongylonema pulchrum]|uniref:G_PROTEIN_RECEP_F1_2 domain-containing protein n=1 Tax=Gongylonema pulchrum TaxID=637853 RepID=A0A183EVF1_9BILA|nr:unnamed protein product [Gongylonema pulchrum]
MLLLGTLLNAAGLLIHSIDRMLAIIMPVYYYNNSFKIMKRLLYLLYAVAVTPTLTMCGYTLMQPSRNISIQCNGYNYLTPFQATAVLLLGTLLNAAGLLIHSIDRMLAIIMPVYYYNNSFKIMKRLLYLLYAIAVTPTLTMCGYTLMQPSRNISIQCK